MRKRILKYPRTEAPVLAEVIRETGVLHFLRADLTAEGEEPLLSLESSEVEILRASLLLRERGVEICEEDLRIRLDRESCTDCGACVFPCPTRPLGWGRIIPSSSTMRGACAAGCAFGHVPCAP